MHRPAPPRQQEEPPGTAQLQFLLEQRSLLSPVSALPALSPSFASVHLLHLFQRLGSSRARAGQILGMVPDLKELGALAGIPLLASSHRLNMPF